MSKNDDFQHDILSIADDFKEAYRRCVRGEDPEVDEYGRTFCHFVGVPAIVNAAFACELYLKSLLGEKIKEIDHREWHDLKALYSQLDTPLQNQIREYVETHWIQPDGHSFDDQLERAKDVFVSWRYIFEEKHTDGYMGCFINEHLKFFELFITILQKLACEKKETDDKYNSI